MIVHADTDNIAVEAWLGDGKTLGVKSTPVSLKFDKTPSL